MNLDAARHGDETEHVVAIHRTATAGHLKVQAFQVAVNHQNVVAAVGHLAGFGVEIELLGRACGGAFGCSSFAATQFGVGFQQDVDVQFLVGQCLVELVAFLEAHLLNQLVDEALFPLHLAVLEFAGKEFAGHRAFAGLEVAHGSTYLRFGVSRDDNVQPFVLGPLRGTGLNLHGIAAGQCLAHRNVAAVDTCAHTVVAHG